jgi:hypothetical protein
VDNQQPIWQHSKIYYNKKNTGWKVASQFLEMEKQSTSKELYNTEKT